MSAGMPDPNTPSGNLGVGPGSVGTSALQDGSVTAAKIAAGAVGVAAIAAAIAGTGLSGGGGSALAVQYGTTAGTATQGNDSRVVNAVQTSRQVLAGTGLTGGGDLTADRTLTVSYGTTGTTATVGNDARLPPAPGTQGRLLYDTGSAWTTLGTGTAGYVLSTNGVGANPTWIAPATLLTSGADASRPAASAGLVGQSYWATDTSVLYTDVSSSAWVVTATGYDRASFGPFTDANYLDGPVGTEPAGGSGETLAVLWYATAVPNTNGHLWLHSDGSARGWVFGFDASSNPYLYLFGTGAAGYNMNNGQITAGNLNAPHCIALTITGGNLRWSYDGAAVSTAAITTTFAAPNSSDPFRHGRGIGTSLFVPNVQVVASKAWNAALSDSDLVAIATAHATGRIPDGSSGTVLHDLAAARYPVGTTSIRTVRGSAAGRWTVAGTVDVVPR